MKKRLLSAAAFAVVLGIEILIALFVHDSFVRPYLGDVLAVMCVYFFTRVITVKTKYMSIPVTLFAFFVELVQITKLDEILPAPLAIIVGGTFDFTDLLCYLVGGAVCFVIDKKFFE
ncbi:MAG: DUF2809 domain-containing protein [Oscillospiraceae bacterium]|nr:DUF2809 domain-containing protein [Oscillospiraceae bacterium]